MITPELVAFIKNALDKGQTKEQITNALLGAGWAQLDIIEAFQNTAPLQPSNPIPPVMASIQQNPMASPMAIKTMPGTIATNVAVTNKPSGGSSGVGKMILGLILGLLLASAGWWYYFTQMNPVAIEEMPVMEEQMPIPEAEPVSEMVVENTPADLPQAPTESNCVTNEILSTCAYLTGFEKKPDGSWYLSFDNIWFDPNVVGPIMPINNSSEIKVLKASQDLKVVVDFKDVNNIQNFSDYQLKLIKKGNNYWNPTIQPDSFQHNGLYDLIVKDGMVIQISEGGDFTEPQGT